MNDFTTHHLRFRAEVQTHIQLNQHKGSAIRGALFHALRRQFCFHKEAKVCRQDCPLYATCPICFLVSTVNPQSGRGADVPRPYTIEPPLGEQTRYQPGETLEFGLTMFAQSLNLFPYVIMAHQIIEQGGLGRRVKENGWRRGTFVLREIATVNPLTGERQVLLQAGQQMVTVPDLPVTDEQVQAVASTLPTDRLTLNFKTPLRLIDENRLVHHIAFRPLVQRLHQRLRDLTREFTDTPWDFDFREVMEQAEAVEIVEDHTHWVELDSYSTRQRRSKPLGGLVGRVTFAGTQRSEFRILKVAGELAPFLPWLVWGQFVHVGKDAVKGNGWYEIVCI